MTKRRPTIDISDETDLNAFFGIRGEALRLVCGMVAAAINHCTPERVNLRPDGAGWKWDVWQSFEADRNHMMLAFMAGRIAATSLFLFGFGMGGFVEEARAFTSATERSLQRYSAGISRLAQKLVATGELGAADVEKMMLEDEDRAVAKQAAKR
jgi:hypothetical protein